MIALVLLLATALPATGDERCVGEIPCPLGERSYHVKEPDGWDGVTPLPVLMHFHGWQRQGTLIVKHGRISGATRRAGVLLLAPNGRGRTWTFRDAGSEDIAFGRAVLADAAKRYPIDRDRIYVSGYSYGSAMAWRFACAAGADVTALLAISGTLRQNEECPAPVDVRHVHGLSDTVMDFPMGPGGDELFPVALWRRVNGCAGAPVGPRHWAVTQHDAFRRFVWSDCASGKPVRLDLHDRGHFIPRGWIAQQLEELLAQGSLFLPQSRIA
ncbi:polyhydroxybutyrate depolymerase [Algicella marina]|uniref:Polyhydroxybutyrate depolymerase n=2 Tax=Algicella marina TaxID=2683284 RepID=A0A6P1T6H4_9RHOB|nr:polyhydroxybutyrate depolymerase [Algicella marina]